MSKLPLLLAPTCLATAILTAAPAFAQDQPTFGTMAAPTRPPLTACPLAEYPDPPGKPAGAPPFFRFNVIWKDAAGNAIPGFSCQMIGPFHINGKDWYLQNVRGLIPIDDDASKNRTNAVRICSEHAKEKMERVKADITILGPFGTAVGGAGCERLWKEDYTLP